MEIYLVINNGEHGPMILDIVKTSEKAEELVKNYRDNLIESGFNIVDVESTIVIETVIVTDDPIIWDHYDSYMDR